MFFNNPLSTRSILANNENATVRSKSNGDNVTKKTLFNENGKNTPLRSKGGSKGAQATQRRRRAFGDISNRKAVGTAGGGNGNGGALKQKASSNATQRLSKPGSSKEIFPPSSAKLRHQVKVSKTPSTTAGVGGGNGLKNAGSKREQRTSSTEYDGVFGVTTLWSKNDTTEEDRSLFDLVPEDELNLVSDFQDEMMERQEKESCEKDRLERKRYEEQLSEQIRDFHEVKEEDTDVGGGNGFKSAGSKREQRTSSTEYDGVFGVTTRWSKENLAAEDRSLFDLVPDDELNLVSDFRDEMTERREEESREKDRLEHEKCEEQLSEQIREFHELNDKDIEEMGTNEELDFLNETLPWEEEDDDSDYSEERPSPGLDHHSLWGDV